MVYMGRVIELFLDPLLILIGVILYLGPGHLLC